MKTALLGDIHGNAAALDAVLSAARREGVELLLVTGDLVGYYFAPATVLALLAPWKKYVVRGNHEDMLAAVRDNALLLPGLEQQYGSGLRVALESLTKEQLDELCTLPHPLALDINGRRILLSHGAPWDNDLYIYQDVSSEVIERCAELDVDVIVTGHTHYPMCLTAGAVRVVNPGSVGQPRNRQPGAQWAMFDTASNEITLRCESYDFQPLIEECRIRHPDIPYLGNVLERT